jgi:hypothetical protein
LRTIFSQGAYTWSWLQQTWSFEFRVQPGTGTEEVNFIAQQVVPLGAVAAA